MRAFGKPNMQLCNPSFLSSSQVKTLFVVFDLTEGYKNAMLFVNYDSYVLAVLVWSWVVDKNDIATYGIVANSYIFVLISYLLTYFLPLFSIAMVVSFSKIPRPMLPFSLAFIKLIYLSCCFI